MRCFDDLRDGFVAGEKGEEEAVGGFGELDLTEEVGRLSHEFNRALVLVFWCAVLHQVLNTSFNPSHHA